MNTKFVCAKTPYGYIVTATSPDHETFTLKVMKSQAIPGFDFVIEYKTKVPYLSNKSVYGYQLFNDFSLIDSFADDIFHHSIDRMEKMENFKFGFSQILDSFAAGRTAFQVVDDMSRDLPNFKLVVFDIENAKQVERSSRKAIAELRKYRERNMFIDEKPESVVRFRKVDFSDKNLTRPELFQ